MEGNEQGSGVKKEEEELATVSPLTDNQDDSNEPISQEGCATAGSDEATITQDPDNSRVANRIIDVTSVEDVNQSEISSLNDEAFEEAPASPSEAAVDQFIVDENVSLGSSSELELRLRKNSSSSDYYEYMCRICHEMDQNERMISPCKCKGTLSLVHRSCLQHWLAESDSSHCELCGYKYLTKRCPKYSLLGSVLSWLSNNRRQRKQMIFDLLATIAFIPLAGVGTYIGIGLAESLQTDEEAFGSVSGRLAALSVISLVTTLDVAYATWAIIKVQTHLANWYSWYRRNSEVTLIPP